MKKITLGLIAFAIAFSSCNKNEEKDNDLNGENIVVSNPKTPEDHKANLEQTGISLADDLIKMKDEVAVDVMEYSMDYFENSQTIGDSPVGQIMKAQVKSTEGTIDPSVMIRALKTTAEDPQSWTEMWDSITGIYEYSFVEEDFVQVSADGDELLIKFPGDESAEASQENNAFIRVHGFATYDGPFPADYDDLVADLPEGKILSKIQWELGYEENTAAAYIYDLAFDANGYFDKIQVTYIIGSFSYVVLIDNDEKTMVQTSASLKYDNKILLGGAVSATGDWSESNINENIYSEQKVEVYWFPTSWGFDETTDEIVVTDSASVEYTVYYDYFDIHNIIQGSSVSIQLVNIKIVGEIDMQGLGDALIELDEKYSNLDDSFENDSAYAMEEAEIMNQYVSLKCIYADNEKLIAEVEVHPVIEIDDYWGEKYINTEPYFVFEDGTKVHPEIYFTEEFDKFWDEINSMINDINQEFELEIEDVDPDDL